MSLVNGSEGVYTERLGCRSLFITGSPLVRSPVGLSGGRHDQPAPPVEFFTAIN